MKKLLLLLVTLATVSPSFAQSDDGEDEFSTPIFREKKNAFFFGPKIGGTWTTMTQPNEGNLYDKGGLGFSGGLAMKFRFGRATENSDGGTGFIGLGLEFKYKQNNVKTLGFDEDGKANANMSMNYFEVPLYVHIYPLAKTRGMNTFYIELGASIAGILNRSPKNLTLSDPSPEFSRVTYHLDDDMGKIKGGDIRLMGGIGYTIPSTGLDINARYNLGTSKLAGNFPCKMNSAELSLSYMFRIAKF